jgi:transcriptional regulator with XRE-family HTH domain
MTRREIAVDPTFATRLRELRVARGMSYRDFGTVSRSYVHELESGQKRPTPEIATALDRALDARGQLAALVRVITNDEPEPPSDDDELAAIDLARRVAASDVGAETLDRLDRIVDDLATRYPVTPPAELLPITRRHLGYAGRLLEHGVRKTLEEHRRLIVLSAWLSLLAATLHIDLKRTAAAGARLATAASLARQAGHTEIEAWVFETRAWAVLTEGDYRRALDLSSASRRLAPKGSSIAIQAAAQEGRAWARLGAQKETYAAVNRVNQLVAPLSRPDRAEHHYRYDPDKAVSYTATTLAWLGDPAAEGYAREVVARLGGSAGWPRRVAAAQLDLSLTLLSVDRPEEAAAIAQEAIASGRIVPSNHWRAHEVVTGVENRGLPEATDLRDAFEALRRSADGADASADGTRLPRDTT